MFFVFRFISALACSGPVAIGGGVVADVTTAEKRAKSLAIWALGPLLGPVRSALQHDLRAECARY